LVLQDLMCHASPYYSNSWNAPADAFLLFYRLSCYGPESLLLHLLPSDSSHLFIHGLISVYLLWSGQLDTGDALKKVVTVLVLNVE